MKKTTNNQPLLSQSVCGITELVSKVGLGGSFSKFVITH